MNLSDLTTFLSEEEANAIRTLIEARAKALGLTIESFLEQFPLDFQKDETEPNKTFSMDEWKQQRDTWHKDSHNLTKNDDGSPKVFYHGTHANFEAFEDKYIGTKNDDGFYGRGFYFGSAGTATFFAERHYSPEKTPNIIPAYLKIKNPLVILENTNRELEDIPDLSIGDLDITGMPAAEIVLMALSKGHDGVAVKTIGYGETPEDATFGEWVAFQPNQIKSIFNRGTFDPENNSILYQAAYHGTPHEVDKFTTAKIGTGEGNQSFGYGLYFASNKDVANYYKTSMLSREDRIAYDKAVEEINNLKNLISEAEATPKLNSQIPKLKEFLLKAEQKRDEFSNKGNLYKVELKPQDHEYLLWDSPLSGQSKYVQKKLNEIIHSPEYEGLLSLLEESLQPFENSRGHSIYSALGSDMSIDSAKQYPEASKLLHAFGIKGIKYLDGNSRNVSTLKISPPDTTVSGKWMVKGEDYDSKGVHFDTEKEAEAYLKSELQKLNYNYVIFHDDDVEIVERLNQCGVGSRLPKALIEFGIKPGETFAVIKLFKEADVSSLPHELAHYFRRTLEPDLLAHAEEVFAVKDHKWDNKQEEAFALGFVKYLATCNAPSEKLEETFAHYGEWLRKLWNTLQGTPESQFEITPEHKALYDKMLSAEEHSKQRNTKIIAKFNQSNSDMKHQRILN